MKIKAESVQYRVEVLPEDMPVRGNALASGDPAEDKRVEDEIIERLECGDIWAWCTVRVVASLPDSVLEGEKYLGACSYRDLDDFMESGYYEDMRDCALEELQDKVALVYGSVEK